MRRSKSKTPMRRCIVCRESRPQKELFRFTLSGGHLVPDADGRSEGRGYYLCRDMTCAEAALAKKAFNRACRYDLDTDEVARVIEEVFNN